MGRSKKYLNEEDRIEAIRKASRRYSLKTSIANDDGIAIHKAKHKMYRYPGIKVTLETFDKFYISTVCISYKIGFKWFDGMEYEMMDDVGKVCDFKMKEWLNSGQTDWSPKYHIMVWERAENSKSGYIPKKSYLAGEQHLKRITVPVSWYDTRKELEDVIKMMVDTIKKTCDETGLELYVKEK